MRNKLLNLCLTAMMMLFGASAWAIDKVGEVYQIGTVEDLEAFAALVNGGENSANAVVTADIDCGTSQKFTIGTNENRFKGKFDGQGHTITINSFPDGDGNGNLFRNIEVGGEVCNVITAGTITTGYKYAAGIASWSRGYIHNCATFIQVTSNIPGDATHAGIVAVPSHGAIVNCLSAMVINGDQTENCGGIAGWSDGRLMIRNCLSVAEMSLKNYGGCGSITRNPGNIQNNNDNKGRYQQNFFLNTYGGTEIGKACTPEELASGAICYQLNAGVAHPQWTQKEGDPYPMPFPNYGKTVGADTQSNCMGLIDPEAAYTFGGGIASEQHEIVDGRCLHCGYLPLEDMEFGLSGKGIVLRDAEDVKQYSWFRYLCGDEVNAVMANDIDMEDYPYVTNPDNWCSGIFDGAGHTLTIALSNEDLEKSEKNENNFIHQPFGSGMNTVFHNLSGNGQVHDLFVTGSIYSMQEKPDKFAATITNHVRDDKGSLPRIYNVYSDVEIESTLANDNTVGGFVGVAESNFVMENVAFAGKIYNENGADKCFGGFIGWAAGVVQVRNALMIGEMEVGGGSGDNHIISRNANNVQPTNVYYVPVTAEVSYDGNYKEIEDESDLESGALTYALNGDQTVIGWTQTLGVDEAPVPLTSHKQVYAQPSDGYRCDGTPLGAVEYSNTPSTPVIPDHKYKDGFCTVCGYADYDYVKPNEDGVYEIATAGQLANFSQAVNYKEGMLNANIVLTDDIDMEEEIEIDGESLTFSDLFVPFGVSEQKPFCGTFDGQFHTISNLNIDRTGRGVGLFGNVASYSANSPVKIENVVMDETCSIHGGAYVGLIGMSSDISGGSSETNVIIMNNVGIECDITADGANAGGIIGCCMGSQATFWITNCYTTGHIKGGKESSAMTGWFGSHAHCYSCWTISEVEGVDSQDKYFGRFGGEPELKNCFTLNGSQNGVGNIQAEDVTSGKLTWDLNGHSFAAPNWYQNLNDGDEHPSVLPSRGSVYYTDEYASATDEETESAASDIIDFVKESLEDVVAQKATIAYFKAQVDAMADCQTMNELGAAYDELDRDSLQKSIDVYAEYKKTIDEIATKLEGELKTLSGADVEALKAYLEDAEEKVYEAGELDVPGMKAEIAKVKGMLEQAIRTCYGAGMDVTDLMANADFSLGTEGWTWANDVKANGTRTVVNTEGETCYAIECWNQEFDMCQTIEGLKPGVYEFTLQAAYRPSDNIYSYNHAAYIYANGIRNYIMTSGEDMLEVTESENGLNCYIDKFETDKVYEGTYDFCYFDDPESNVEANYESEESGKALDRANGTITRGPVGMALAGKAGRYTNKVIGVVGEDGKLTIGACNPGAKYGADGTLMAYAKLKYLGTAEEANVADAFASMKARAISVVEDYNPDGITDLISEPGVPYFEEALNTALTAAANASASIEAAQALSKLFAQVYDSKLAYKNIFYISEMLTKVAEVDCVDIPDGVEPLFTDEEIEVFAGKGEDVMDGYYNGSFSSSDIDALLTELQAMGMPKQDEDGVWQVGTAKNMVFAAAAADAKIGKMDIVMTNDIDMSGVNFNGFGQEGTARYEGTFDGQDYKLMNIYVNHDGQQSTGFFDFVGNATVKNVQVDANCVFNGGPFTGFIGSMDGNYTLTMDRVATYATVNCSEQNGGGLIGCCRGDAKEHITNCFVAGTITSGREGGAISGWLATSSDTYVRNCLNIATIVNGDDNFRRGDGPTDSNNYSLNGGTGATKVTSEQLASGEIAYKLNGSSVEDPVWFQTLGTDTVPVLFGSDAIVYMAGGKYTNEEPYMGLNAFAYNVTVNSTADQVEVSYTLNAEAESVSIVFYSEGTEIFRTGAPVECLGKGDFTVTIQNSDIAEPGTPVTFEVVVTPKELLDPQHVGTFELPVWSPQGLAVNNVPTSAGFGQVYVVNAEDMAKEGYDGKNYLGGGEAGLYALTPDFELINEKAYTGGVEFVGNATNYDYDPRTVRVSEDGRVFVGSTVASASPLYEANAANLSADWTPVFQGGEFDETEGVVYIGDDKQVSPIISFDVDGKGADLKIGALMCNNAFKAKSFNAEDTWAAVYNLGTATAWSAVPSKEIAGISGLWSITPATIQLLSDHRGGYWYFQYRSAPNETNPAIKHVDKDGNVDFSNPSNALPGAAAAITADGNTLAYISKAGQISVFDIDYTVNVIGQITLKPICNIAAKNASQLQSMAFDFAGNLYTGSAAAERLDRYSVPTNGNNTTPSVDNFKIGDVYTGIENIENAVGPMANGYIYNIAGQRQAKAQRGLNIINGKKVVIK